MTQKVPKKPCGESSKKWKTQREIIEHFFPFEGFIFSPWGAPRDGPNHHLRHDGSRIGPARRVGGRRASTTGRQRRERNEGRRRARLAREQRWKDTRENARRKSMQWRRSCIMWLLLGLVVVLVGVGGGLGCGRALQLQQHENEKHSYIPADGTDQHTKQRPNKREREHSFPDRAWSEDGSEGIQEGDHDDAEGRLRNCSKHLLSYWRYRKRQKRVMRKFLVFQRRSKRYSKKVVSESSKSKKHENDILAYWVILRFKASLNKQSISEGIAQMSFFSVA